MAGYKKQHKTAQTHLQGWVVADQLWAYRRAPGENPPFKPYPVNIRDAAAENHFYSVKTIDGRDNSIEAFLQQFERGFGRLVAEVARGSGISPKIEAQLKDYVAAQAARGEFGRDSSIEEIERITEAACAMAVRDFPNVSEDRIRDLISTALIQFYQLKPGVVVTPANLSRARLPELIEEQRRVFSKYHLCIIESRAHNFLVSDAPVTAIDPGNPPGGGGTPYGVIESSATLEKVMPLTPRTALLLVNAKIPRRLFVPAPIVSIVNARIAFNAVRSVFARPDEEESARHRQRYDILRADPFCSILAILNGLGKGALLNLTYGDLGAPDLSTVS